jgi:hypothetical protein
MVSYVKACQGFLNVGIYRTGSTSSSFGDVSMIDRVGKKKKISRSKPGSLLANKLLLLASFETIPITSGILALLFTSESVDVSKDCCSPRLYRLCQRLLLQSNFASAGSCHSPGLLSIVHGRLSLSTRLD